MFHKSFYPTPKAVIEQMIDGLSLKGKTVLEPSSGKADIVKALKDKGAKVLACEINDDLAKITAHECDTFLKQDFFEVCREEISHIDYIVMNPPFDDGVDHILNAWDIAPEGCTIISLSNAETYHNPCTRQRRKLKSIIDELGTVEDLGDVFSQAERKTGVNVALIKLYKPKSKTRDEFEGFFFTDEEAEEFIGQDNGLVKFSRVREIVGRYIQSVKMFDDVIKASKEINEAMKPLGADFKIQFDTSEQRGNIYNSLTRDEFKVKLQKSAWKSLFVEMNMGKYLTQSVLDELNKKIESQKNLPLTEKNIYNVVSVIAGTHKGRMEKVMVDVFDWLTERHHGNRSSVEGWKTNSMYFVGEKFIAPYAGIGMGYSGYPEVRWSSSGEKLDELVKALCVLDGKNYDDCVELYDFFKPIQVPNGKAQEIIDELGEILSIELKRAKYIHEQFKYFSEKSAISREKVWQFGEWGFTQEEIDKIIGFYQQKNLDASYFGEKYQYKEWGKWHDFNFFKIKVYKKGTCHCQFKDKKLLENFNKTVAKIKGWNLPSRTGSDFRRKEQTDIILRNE